MHERVEAAAVRHAEHDFLDAELPAALEDLLDSGDQRFAAIEAEALGADELDAEIVLEALRLDDPLQDHLAALERELGVVLDVLDALLDPRLLVGIGDVHELDADLAAVGLAQAVHDLAKRRLLAECQRAEDQDRAVPITLGEAVGRGIELAMRRLPHQAQRIEIGLEMEKFGLDKAKADDDEVAKVYEKRGIKAYDIDQAQADKWKAVARDSCWKEFADKNASNAEFLKLSQQVS